MENVYEICFYGGLILAIVLLIAAVVLFVVLKIPKVLGELTGRSAKKAMREMRDGNTSPGSIAKKEQEKYYNMGSGKITAKETVSSTEYRKTAGNDSTELLDNAKRREKKFEQTDVLGAEDDTTDILREDDATDILNDTRYGNDDATDVLSSEDGDDGATDVLSSDDGDDGATDVLSSDEPEADATDILSSEEDDDATDVLRGDEDGTSVLSSKSDLSKKVKVIYNVVIVHTDESIE